MAHVPLQADQISTEVQRLLLRWTGRRMGTSTNKEFRVTPEEVARWGRAAKLTDADVERNFMLITIFLRDVKFYKSAGRPMPYQAFLSAERKMIFRKPDGTPEEFK